jgi:transposase
VVARAVTNWRRTGARSCPVYQVRLGRVFGPYGRKIHRRRDVRAFLERHPRVEVHRFPGYAPELNPDEFVWAQAKRELSNIDSDGLVTLTLHVVRSLQRIGRSQALLRSCLHASDLPWP